MADVRINAGIHRRLAKGGLLRITKSESDYAIGYLEPGSTSYQRGGVDKKPVHDEHGEFDGKYTFGNERPSTLRIRMPATDDGLAGEGDTFVPAGDLLATFAGRSDQDESRNPVGIGERGLHRDDSTH